MAIIGVPKNVQQSLDYSVIHGLRVAIEALMEPSELQREKRTKKSDAGKLINKGRVICITSTRDDASLKSLKNIFLSQILAHNKQAASSDE